MMPKPANQLSDKSSNIKLITCKKTIWVGNFIDKKGNFEILVPACNREDALDKVISAVKDIKAEKKRVTTKIEEGEDLIYLEDVGDFDYIRV